MQARPYLFTIALVIFGFAVGPIAWRKIQAYADRHVKKDRSTPDETHWVTPMLTFNEMVKAIT